MTALVAPLEVPREMVIIDLPLMVLVSLVCIPIFLSGKRISRAGSIVLVRGNVIYLGTVITLRT